MSSSVTSRKWVGLVVAVATALVVGTSSGTAGAQAGDPIAFTATPPSQTTPPGSQAHATFTIADIPPCGAEKITTLDSLDVELSDPSALSTIDSFTVSEPPASVASNISPDMRTLTLLFDSAFPCQN